MNSADSLVYAGAVDSNEIDDVSTQVVTTLFLERCFFLLVLASRLQVLTTIPEITNIRRLFEDCRDQYRTGTAAQY